MQKSAVKEIVKNMIAELLDDADVTANSEPEITDPNKIELEKEKEKLNKISINIDKLSDEKSKILNTIRSRIDNIDKKLAAEKKKRDDVSKRIAVLQSRLEEIANSGYGNEFLKFKLDQKKSATIDQSIKEEISLTKDTDHLISRIKLAANLCDKLGDKPLLFRQFRHKEIGQKLIVKVINHGEKNKIKGGRNKDEQIKLLDALGVQKPIFCRLDAPGGLEGMHGMSNIVVPPDDFKLYYSDVVVDFGANIVKNDNYDQAERITADKFAHTYKTGWPEKSSLGKNHEIILDCDFYYLLDIKSFLVGYFGIGARDMIIKRYDDRPELPVSTFANLNRLLFSGKIKTYRDVSVYLAQIVEKIKLGDKNEKK